MAVESMTRDRLRVADADVQSRLSLVVPVFRLAAILPRPYARILAVIEPLDPAFELILVEDDGGDASWDVITALAQADPRIVGLRLVRNHGQHNALLCGIRTARGEIIATLDDDLQNPLEETWTCWPSWNEDGDWFMARPPTCGTDS